MVGRKNCRGGGGGEAARERERASKRLAGTRAGWRSRSPEAVAASAEKGPREAEVGRPLGRGAGLIAPGGNQDWMDEPVVGGGDCQTPRKGRGKRRRKRVPQREASPDAPDGDWVRKEERSLEVVTAKRRGRAAGSGGEHGCLRERRVPAHQMETGCEKKRRCGRRLRRKGRGDAPWPGRGRYGIVVGAGGQHGVCPVTERTHHRFERNDGVKASGVSDQTRRGGAV